MFSGGSVCGKTQTGGKWAASFFPAASADLSAQQPAAFLQAWVEMLWRPVYVHVYSLHLHPI